jgi:hypothetical protein
MALINDQVFIAHADKDASTGMYEAVVDQWNGSAWVRVGEGFEPFAATGGLDLTVDGNGDLVLAWAQGAPMPSQINVSRRSNGTWSQVGSASRDTTAVINPSLAVDTSTSQVLVAWDQADSSGIAWTPYVRELPATDLGSSPAGTVPINSQTYPSLVSWNSEPVVAWTPRLATSSTLEVDRWSGSAWVRMGSLLPAAPSGRQHQLISAAGSLAVATVFDFGYGHAAIFEWDGTAMDWRKVCSDLVDPVTPTAMVTQVTGIALTRDGQGDYVVGLVQVSPGKLFVEKVSH